MEYQFRSGREENTKRQRLRQKWIFSVRQFNVVQEERNPRAGGLRDVSLRDEGKRGENVRRTRKIPPDMVRGGGVQEWRWDCESKSTGRTEAFGERERSNATQHERDVLGLRPLRWRPVYTRDQGPWKNKLGIFVVPGFGPEPWPSEIHIPSQGPFSTRYSLP